MPLEITFETDALRPGSVAYVVSQCILCPGCVGDNHQQLLLPQRVGRSSGVEPNPHTLPKTALSRTAPLFKLQSQKRVPHRPLTPRDCLGLIGCKVEKARSAVAIAEAVIAA